jgi:hypothetical protein
MSKLINDEIFICEDCYMDHHEGRAMKDQSVSWTDNNSEEDGEELRTIEFSASPCGCCGTTLAGHRYQMAIWEL